MARGVKSNFRASRIVLVKYMSSVSALTIEIYKNVSLDKQHPLLARTQCHSNTTISLKILATTLPARLLQYPNVNSLASSLAVTIFVRDRSVSGERTQSMLQVLTNGERGGG